MKHRAAKPLSLGRTWRFIFPALLFSLALLVFLLTAKRSVNAYDEGVILTAAMEVANGYLPHRDFYANYGPAQFYLLAALFKLFGPSILIERLWGALVKAFVVLAAYLLGRRLLPAGWSLLSCLCSLLWLCFVENSIWPAWPALLATLLSINALFTAFERRNPGMYLLLCGAYVGAATLFRYDIGFLLCLTESGMVLTYSLGGRTPWERVSPYAPRHLLTFCSGVAVVCAPVFLAFLHLGAAADFYFDMVFFPAHNYAVTRSLPFPMPAAGDVSPLSYNCIVYFPLFVAAAIITTFSFSNRVRHGFSALEWKQLLLLAVTLCLFAKGLVRVSPLHMALAIVPAFILLATLIANHTRNSRMVVSLMLGLATLAALLPTIDAFAAATTVAANNVAKLKGACASRLSRLGCFDVESSQILATEYLQKRTHPGDPIFVGLTRHDRIFVNNVGFYFLANLHPATKWYHFDPGLQTMASIQALIIEDLKTARPEYVVLDSEWDSVHENNASSSSSGVPLLDQFIQAHFQKVETFGSFSVFRATPMPM